MPAPCDRHADALLVAPGSGAIGLPASAGVTLGAARDTLVVPFNDVGAVETALAGGDVAAVIVEPVAANDGVTPPAEGYLEALRRATQARDTLLVFDEVITGFRIARGGATERYDVTPDLVVLGKIIGGGLPVGAYGGRADLMALVAPDGPVYQAGTLSGNPLAMAAGAATLRELKPAVYERLETAGAALAAGLEEAAGEAGIALRVDRVGSLLGVTLPEGAFAPVFHAMLAAGILLPPSPHEAWFVSSAHSDADIDATLRAARGALAAIARER